MGRYNTLEQPSSYHTYGDNIRTVSDVFKILCHFVQRNRNIGNYDMRNKRNYTPINLEIDFTDINFTDKEYWV